MEILAHRCNLAGPDPVTENSLAAAYAALAEGFGLETDLRRDATGRFYIAHDAADWSTEHDFERFAALFQKYPHQSIALNVKELGWEAELIGLQRNGAFGQCSFLFDFELLEPISPGRAQRFIRTLPGGAEAVLASRLSDRSENLAQCLAIPAEVAWVDEFDTAWVTLREIDALRAADRRIHVVSPELHGRDETARLRRWADYKTWGVDGVCTDFALAAREFFAA